MIGLIVRCDGCGREDIETVYYVGTDTTHCAACYLKIFSSMVNAEPRFNTEAVQQKLNEEYAEPVPEDLFDVRSNPFVKYTRVGPLHSRGSAR